MMEWWNWAWSWLTYLVSSAWQIVVQFAQRNPVTFTLLMVGFLRLWGTTVQTGYAGVLFRFGRAVKILEPGFHPLLPIIQEVRKLPIRSITLQIPPQRIMNADGLVYDADATLVMRIVDPIKATVEIDNLRHGCITTLALGVAEVITSSDRQRLGARGDLDAELSKRVQAGLERWGIQVEQAGFNTIAPTRTTTRLSQQRQRTQERAAVLQWLIRAGNLAPCSALILLGATRRVVGRSQARYHRLRQRSMALPELTPVLMTTEDEPLDDDLPV
ncbi:MAG: SPFH domain-containing protein [Gemmataceae bacterium]